jgi:hemoglobin
MTTESASWYEAFGGQEFFTKLVRAFYLRVANDPILRPMYPEDDLGPAELRLRMFLEQYWGGPDTYSQQRGHPRLRMRHAPFPIDETARNRWLTCMAEALDEQELAPELLEEIWRYFVGAAIAMQNIVDDPDASQVAEVTDLSGNSPAGPTT